MSYQITTRVYQTNPNAFFHIVEQGVLTGGTWTQTDGQQVLTMVSSGTSGTIRFQSDTGETFVVALGVHNYKRWCDIVPNLTAETCVAINPQYYGGTRDAQREKQLAAYSVNNAQGRNIAVNFTVADGNNLKANITIG